MDFKSLFTWEIKQLTYAHYDNIQVAFFTPFFTPVYNVEKLVLQTM